MPTNFTVVPVKDNRREAEDRNEDGDAEDNNVLKKEEEDTTGQIRGCFI